MTDNNNNNNNRSNIILMCGCCGSGKSTYSKKKELEEGYIKLSIDESVWNKYGQHGIDFSTEQYREILDKTHIELQKQLIDLIKLGKNVVVDSSFWNRSNRDLYRSIIKETDPLATIQLIYLKSNYQTLHNRLKIRNQTISANSPFVITEETLTHHFTGFQEPNDENEIIILQNE